jgi:hypothetical protein
MNVAKGRAGISAMVHLQFLLGRHALCTGAVFTDADCRQ